MNKKIAIIDPFVKSPAVHCFNNLVKTLNTPCTYYLPSLFGVDALINDRDQNHGYIVLGSASHVHENLPWHRPLLDFLLAELHQNKPTLGCCFGHQLIAYGFGAKVEFLHHNEDKEMGRREIEFNHDALGFQRGERFNLAVTHRQVVTQLPSDLQSIATGLENDIIIHRTLPFLGTQAHPEASHHFSTHDISNLSQPDISLIQRDGNELITRFFKHFNLL